MGFRNFVLGFTLVLSTTGMAVAMTDGEKDYLSISEMTVEELVEDDFNQTVQKSFERRQFDFPEDPIDKASRIISVARDVVALGEELYTLVEKGKPANTVSYEPISVVPKANGQPVDILDTEGWSAPQKRTFEVAFKNLMGITVVRFRYSVFWAHGGTYNGKGAYITSAQIIPASVNTLWGFNFTATMKLGGLRNSGTKENPVAGITMLMEYTISNILQAQNHVDVFDVTGKGGFKKYKK